MKNLSIFKNDKKGSENAPDFRLVASYQDGEGNWQNETVASLWKGDTTKENAPIITGKMSDTREHEGKTYVGYSVTTDAKPQATPEAPSVEKTQGEDVPW